MRKTLLSALLLLLVQHAFSQAGTIDTSFGIRGRAVPLPGNRVEDAFISSFVPQADGKILVFGNYGPTEDYHSVIGRYTMQGRLDRTFSGDGVQTADAVATPFAQSQIAVQPDGKILLAGARFGGNPEDPEDEGYSNIHLVRYHKNGKLDDTFGNSGSIETNVGYTRADGKKVPSYDEPTSIAITSTGSILITSVVHELHNGAMATGIVLIGYTPNGTLSGIQRFYADFANAPDIGAKVSAYKNGGFLLSGRKKDGNVFLYSSLFGEKTISHPSGEEKYRGFDQVHHLLDNGKIAIASNKIFENEDYAYLALLKADGTPDTDFSGDGFLEFDRFITALTSEPNGKIILSSSGVSRYNTNGTLDYSFGTNGKAAAVSYDLKVYGNRLYSLDAVGLVAYILNTADRYVKVNLYANAAPYQNREWNNWHNLHDRHFNNFYYSDSTASGISAVMSNRNGVNDNGTDYGGGMAPAGVLRHSSYSIGARTITFSGLNTGKKYGLELYGSRNAYSSDSTVFTINGVSKKIGTYRNFTKKAVFANLTPDAQGQIVLTISSTKMYNYLNGFILTESFGATASSVQTTTLAKQSDAAATSELQVTAYPNPSRQAFTLQLKSGTHAPLQFRVFDAAGRLVEIKQNVAPNTAPSVGRGYKPGIYFVETTQGGQRRLTRLVKQAQ